MQVVSLAPSVRGAAPLDATHARLNAPAVLRFALLMLVVGNLGRIPLLDLGERQAPLLVNELCVGLALMVGALGVLRARSLQLNPEAMAALVFAMVGGLSAVAAMPRFGLSTMELVASLAYLARWCFYFALYLMVINCTREGDAEPIWRAMERALLAIAAFGIVQAIFLPNFAFRVYPDARELLDWDPQGHRLVSTVLEPNVVAGMLVVVLLVQLARLSSGVRMPLWKPALLLTALVLTLSRSGILAFVCGALIILVSRGLHKRVLQLGGLMVIALIAALPRLIEFGRAYSRFGLSDPSAQARVGKWLVAIDTFAASPWFGIGFNTYGFVQERRGIERLGTAAYSSEGGLLFVAVMTGVIGLALYLALLWLVLRRCRSGWRNPHASPEQRGLLLGSAAATGAILVHSVFVNSLLMPFVMELLWVLWGVSFVIAVALQRRAQGMS